jgi:hypothetical protein
MVLEPGKTYVLRFDGVAGVAANGGTGMGALGGLGVGTHTRTFTPSTAARQIIFWPSGTNATVLLDNVSVKLADKDRSENNKGLIVNGIRRRGQDADLRPSRNGIPWKYLRDWS